MKNEHISKILRKRSKIRGIESHISTMIVYDSNAFDGLKELARKESTSTSSILNNLYEVFLEGMDSPQKTIEEFEQMDTTPSLRAGIDVWRTYLKSLNPDEFKRMDQQFNDLFNLFNRVWRESR